MDENEILINLSESEKTKFGKNDFAIQSVPQKAFSSIWAVESEVNNGGFSQYFLNSSAETSSLVAEALVAIGAPRTPPTSAGGLSCAHFQMDCHRRQKRFRLSQPISRMRRWKN
jgi:hypothetical protein